MVTIVTEVEVKQGSEPQWDDLMRERMAAARKHSGWVGGQLLQPEERSAAACDRRNVEDA